MKEATLFGFRLRRGVLAALLVAVLAAAAGGTAYATSTGGSGTLAACAQTQTGALRLDTGTGCLASERPVQLGTAAMTRADERFYVAPNLTDRSTFLELVNGTYPSVLSNLTHVVTAHVAAGDYAIAAQITVSNHSGDGSVQCLLLDAAGHTHGYASMSAGIDSGFNRDGTMTIDGALSLTTDTDISLACWNSFVVGYDNPGAALVAAADITTKSVDAASVTQEVH
jgi:hypothetical protein